MNHASRQEETRLITKVATLYYERGLTQVEIASKLDISQATVSRMLKRAQGEGIVRITVSAPMGTYPQIEEELETRFGLKDAIVVEGASSDVELLHNLGAAAAFYLETTLKSGETIGISSWSETLLAMANAMHPMNKLTGIRVVQILGGVGNPAAASHAAQLTRRLAQLVNGDVTVLPAPGVVSSVHARDVLLEDVYVNEAFQRFDEVSVALVGVGSIDPSPVLARSGNVLPDEGLEELKDLGAVGDICLRFFDAGGRAIDSPWNERVVGMDLDSLRKVPRAVAIAGGTRKAASILGAVRGGLINVLITDEPTAEHLLESREADQPVRMHAS